MLPFILINVVVSASVALAILFWWENRQADVSTAVPLAQESVSVPVGSTPGSGTAEAAVSAPTEVVPEATEAPPIHVVQPGDTLGSLSEFYGVPLDDIMAANGMTNPNLISVGQQLVIPINGLLDLTPEPEPTVETTAVDEIPTPIATEPAPGGEAIIEISQITGVGDLAAEAVQIRNVGSSSVALQGWRIADQDGLFYTFRQITLFGDGAGILLHTESGQDTATELFWGREAAVWQPGELITLLNADGAIVATYTIPES